MTTVTIVSCIVFCALAARLVTRKRSNLPLPPGPPADPLLGHLRIIPDPETRAETFHEWSKQYGDVLSLKLPGKTLIILNSEKAALDLLERRGAIYSDRPRFPFYDVLGWADTIIFSAYGPFHTRQRKMYQDALGKNVVSEYRGIQERAANVLIKSLTDAPEDFDRHVQRFSGGIVAELGYGHRIESFDDEFFEIGEGYAKLSLAGGTPSLLDINPIFRYWPEWAPGGWFRKTMRESKPYMDEIVFGNYQRVKDEMNSGVARPSFTSKQLEAIYRGEGGPDDHRALAFAAGMIFAAGYDTTWHSVTMFIACMLLHPEVQRKAQEELDRVVGRGRLPDFSDRESLPYLQCVMYETLRWHPVVPLGLPHQVLVDDEYNGMHIPKGATVIANARSITWDETKFKQPRLFRPERFLPKPEGDGETFPVGAVYGWGRRICAGRHLAEGSVWIALARILATLTISSAKDAQGREIDPKVNISTAITIIRPRDDMARKAIEDSSID
ncbi:cytochrome P450 [Irpex lacteus]|nr:cytochrome P450 [Irpex lacteus]